MKYIRMNFPCNNCEKNIEVQFEEEELYVLGGVDKKECICSCGTEYIIGQPTVIEVEDDEEDIDGEHNRIWS